MEIRKLRLYDNAPNVAIIISDAKWTSIYINLYTYQDTYTYFSHVASYTENRAIYIGGGSNI